jgi:hypothetical protein
MKAPNVNRINPYDLGEIGLKLKSFLTNLNNFMIQVAQGFANNITFEENIHCEIKTVTFSLNPIVVQKIKLNKLNHPPSCVLLGSIKQVSPELTVMASGAVSLQWSSNGEDVFIHQVDGTFVANALYKLTLVIF